jgi:hypothetical protein
MVPTWAVRMHRDRAKPEGLADDTTDEETGDRSLLATTPFAAQHVRLARAGVWSGGGGSMNHRWIRWVISLAVVGAWPACVREDELAESREDVAFVPDASFSDVRTVPPDEDTSGTVEYDGQCEDVFGPGLIPPVGFEQFTREDQDRQCAFAIGCDSPSWSPRFNCPDWLPYSGAFICLSCWNQQCIDVGYGGSCPEPPYEYVAEPQVLGDCGSIYPNREQQAPEVLAALDRICAIADDCAYAGVGDCEGGDEYTARCGACFDGICEFISDVIPCTPPTPEDAWP